MAQITSAFLVARASPSGVLPAPRTGWHTTRELSASVRRHPSSHIEQPPGVCASCGFRTPTRDQIITALESLPHVWETALAAEPSPERLDGAARVRDELHAVTNRVSRILVSPGSPVLATVVVDAPSSLAGSASPRQVVVRVLMAAQRAADLARTLDDTDWDLVGRLGAATIRVDELLAMPLHRSHRRLAKGSTCR